MVCADLCQQSPIRAKSAFTLNEIETIEGFISMDLWRKFRLVELDQVMRQDNGMFLNMLNNILVREIDKNVEYQHSLTMIHISANAPTKKHNENQLSQIPGKLINVQFLKILKCLM